MVLKPGSRWKSAVCHAEAVVVRPPNEPHILECGGHPMISSDLERPQGLALSPDHSAGVNVGKRYVDELTGIEVLGVKAGAGSLSLDGRPLKVKEAKPLPSSD
jgi:hypothetical protein